MMQDGPRENVKETNEVRTVEINEGNLTPLQTVEKAHVIPTQSNFGADMSGSDDDEASEVDSFILDENEMDGNEEVLETSKFLLAAETEEGQQQLQTVDPETHARLEALLEAAGISKLSSKDGKALTDPEVLRTLTSSVSSALDEATQAINCMRSEQQGQAQGAEGAQALAERDAGTVRKLYESGSVPDTTEEGESLLSLACSAGYYELAQVLLAMNANVEDRGIKGDCTPLMEAASGGFVDIVRLLLLHGADVNAQSSADDDTAGNTPLHSAACAGHTNVVKELIANGALVEVHNENGHTPLMEAASAGHVDIAQQLLAAGAGINTHSNEFKESALTLACYKGHLEMVKFLLDAGADQEHKTDEMHTALMEASMDGHVEVARLLLDSGAQVNMPVDSFESPLTLAACGGHVELANLLIERGANIEEVNDEGYTPLMEAAREGHGEMVVLLLSHGADINAQTEETQETALTLACCGGFKEVAEFLIKAGADLELGCSTPLMEASQEGHLDLVDFLLGEASNVHAQTGTNDTALTYACENGHTDVAMRLLSHGAFLEHESEGGRTPLMKAARAGHLCTVKYLIKQGANVNRSTSTNDHTVLSLACAGGHHQVVEELLNNGADPNHKLKDGSTMIIEAAKGGHTTVVKMLLEWPNRLMLTSSMDLAQPDMPHMNMTQGTLEEPRVPVQGLAHIVPPSEPDSQIPTCLNFSSSPGKVSERQGGGKVVGKRAVPTSGVEGKLVGKTNNTVIADPLQQMNHEGAVLADLTDEKATEKVEAIINNIMAKELLDHSGGSKEEQFKRQILEELQKMERELQDKAQAQQQLEQQQQQLLKARSPTVSSTGTQQQRSLPDPLCLPTSPGMDSLPLKDLVVQLPKLLTSPDLAAQSLLPSPPAPHPAPPPIASPGMSVAQQVQPPSPQFYQQPVPSTVVTNGNMGGGNSTGKVSKGRSAAGKTPRTKTSQQQPPLPPPPPQQQPLPSPSQIVAQSVSSTVAPLALNLQMEHNGGSQSHQPDFSQQTPVQVSAEALQLQQQHLAVLSQQQQQQIQQLSYQQLTTQQMAATQQMASPQQQQEQFLQQVLSQHQQVLPALGQTTFQQPLPQLLPQVPQQGQPAPQLLTQQERAQFYQQSLQATHLQHQLLKQTATAAPSAATVAAIPNPASVATPSVPVDKIQQGSLYPSSVDVDSQTESNHDTALTLACAGGHSELVSLLLAKGADIEHRDKKGFTPLILAATAGHLEVVEILLDHGAEIEAQSERTKDTPLSLACSGGRYEVVEMLLNRVANKEHRNVSDYTPLSLAASGGYVNIIKLLLSHGAEINSRTGSKLGISPLMLAAMNGHTQAVKLLLDMGSDINAQIETNRNTALTLACFQGRHEVVSLLVDRKANIEHRAKTGLTPLMEAASGGYVEVGRVLLDKGADVNAPPVPSSRDTALTIAADKGHYRFVELLLHRSASVDVKNKKGNSPLWLACNGGHLDVVQLLVTAGADIDSQDNRKVSCLMAAFRKSHIKVVKWMVKHVSQFPSDTELQRFISTVTDKELQKKCQQCMDIIVSAKDRQAAEANKNANSLLQEIDREREQDELKRQIAAKRRERRKMRKKRVKEDKTKDNKDKNSSPEPESENGAQDQDNEDDDDDDNVQIEPPSATVTSTLGTTLVTNTEAKMSRSSSAKNSSHNPCPVSAVTSAVSSSQTPLPTISSVSEKRQQNAESRKNRRNRKEKMSHASSSKESCVVSAAVITTAILSRASVVTTTSDITLMTNALGKVGLHSNTTSSHSQVATTSVISTVNTISSTPSQSSANNKRKKNDVIKPVSAGKSRVGDLDDFGSYSGGKSFQAQKELDRLNKNMKISTNDMLNLCERDSNVSAKLSPLGTSPRKGQRKEEGWKEVTRKSSKKTPDIGHGPATDECSNCRSKMVNIPGTASDECCHCRSKKVTVPASVISRVIGRGGCNINSIRETSGAHVDIEKSQKGAVDRVITIKGSAEATRMAHTMITSLVQEPEKDLSEIIARVKGKPVEKPQQTPVTIGDFAIGMFTVPTTTSQSANIVSQKSSTSKSGSSRQPAGSSSAVNGRSSGAGVGQAPTNAWQNPVPGSGGPASPRRSPQKQLPPSLVPHSSSAPAPSLDSKVVGRPLPAAPGESRRQGTATSTSTTTPLSVGSAANSMKSLSSSAAGRVGSELRQPAMPSSSAGVVGQKASRPATTSVRVLQRQTGPVRPDPQPLPIVSSHMSNPSSMAVTSSSGMTSPAFSTFHLWNNSSPTPILSKKEDFASVAAAGVVPTQPSSHSGQAAPGSPASTPTNDPTKAPGYKAGIGSASPQTRTDLGGPALAFPGPVGTPEHPDDFKSNSRDPLSGPSGMPILPGLPGDGGRMPPHLSFTGGLPPGAFPNQHHSFFPHQPMYSGPGSLDQKEEYSTPHQPMTLPEIKSTLNPNAPDFQITGTGVGGPGGMVNGYPPQMGDVRNGGDGNVMNFNNGAGGGGGGRVEAGGNNGVNAGVNNMQTYMQLAYAYMRNMSPAVLQQLGMGLLGNFEQELCYNLHRLYMQGQVRSGSPGPGRSPAPGPGGPAHLVNPEGSPGMGPGPGPSPPGPGPAGPSHMSSFISGPSLPRNISPMPGQHRPNSAPCMPDSAPTTPVRPSNIGSPMPPCTPPLSEGKQTPDDRKVLRPIGGERAAQRKLPLNEPNLGGSGDFKMMWGGSEMTKDWMPATSPQMTAAAMPTSVMTSSVVTGSNMAYTLSQRENPAPASDGMNAFHEPFPTASMDPPVDPTMQNPQLMMQQMYPNGLNYNLPMFGSRGSSGGGGGVGDGGMTMWNQAVKAGPNEAGDSEAWRSNWSHTDM
ncbi:ankyrin repeat and KH domain-containing protein 1-like isoform X4 [Babylonia areolata]|uniref:ankyrin repeat and KH domain-containing protein 1-like isoform X4 n=1 Tax=Babylonia areolata TaxID=304850 RepID=UPI003FD617CB